MSADFTTVRGRLISETADLMDRADRITSREADEHERLQALLLCTSTAKVSVERRHQRTLRSTLVTLASEALLWAEALDEASEVRGP